MSKVKSAICLVLTTLVIAALCFVCFVPFSYGSDGMYEFDPIINWTSKEANLGVGFGAGESGYYVGGGYSATYYPEGVISAREYDDNLAGMEEGKDEDEYAEKYARIEGNDALYFDEEHLENGELSETFKSDFAAAVEQLKARYEAMHIGGLRMEIADGYTVRVFVPQTPDADNGYASAFSLFAYSGDLEVWYGSGSDETSATANATAIMPRRNTETIGQYVSGAYTVSDAAGTHYVVVEFTSEGEELLASSTASVADDGYGIILFKMGDETVLPLSLSEAIDRDVLYLSNPDNPFTAEAARALSIVLDSATEGTQSALALKVDDTAVFRALGGDDALMYLYIAFGVCFVGMMVFFFARYKLLAFAHLYTYLLFLLVTLLCIWAIPFVSLNSGTFAAVLLVSLLLSASQAFVYENARKEYALGKTIFSCVKTAYKKCFWHIFDLHIVLAAIGFIVYLISLTELGMFAFVFGLASVFSGICALAVGRFMWAIMMAYTNRKGDFCNFKREEVEDND